MTTERKALRVFLTAGEASGDALGARLMAALRQARPDVEFRGVGGPLMAAEGLDSLFPMEDLAVMGVAEVLPRLPLLMKRIGQTAAAIAHESPAIVVTIDSPDFSFRVVKKLRTMKAPLPRLFHYVAPTVWAWRPGRAAKLARLYDGVICLFPCEPAYFTRAGMQATFAGHSMLEDGWDLADASALRAAYRVPGDRTVIGALFGSRAGEIARTGPQMAQALQAAAAALPGAHILALTLPSRAEQVQDLLRAVPAPATVVTDPAQKWNAFAAMDAALAVSGTVGLELAVAGVPHAICYRMNKLTYALVRPRIRVKYAHLANILLDEPVVPELIQQDCTPDNLTAALLPLLTDGGARARQKQAFSKIHHLLRGEHAGTPAQQAAAFVLGLQEEKTPACAGAQEVPEEKSRNYLRSSIAT